MTRKAKADSVSVMLAPNSMIAFDDPRIPYPNVFASYKMDGIRLFIRYDGALLTRNMLVQPNVNLPEFARLLTEYAIRNSVCFDCEMLIPNATHHGAHGVLLRRSDPIPINTQIHVFDTLHRSEWEDVRTARAFDRRVTSYQYDVSLIHEHEGENAAHIIATQQVRVLSAAEAKAHFQKALKLGYEGNMLRNGDSGYKQGRCGHKGAWLIKFKAQETFDGQIIEVMQQLKMRKGIERQRNEFGRLVQPTKNADNYEPTDSCAAFLVRLEDGTTGEIVFAEGVADAAQRKAWWKERKTLVGRWLEFKAYPGGKDSIRSGRMTRWRDDKEGTKVKKRRVK